MKTEPMLTYVLRQLSESKGQQKIIAVEAGVPYSTLAKITQGVVENPGIRHIQALHDYFQNAERCSTRKAA